MDNENNNKNMKRKTWRFVEVFTPDKQRRHNDKCLEVQSTTHKNKDKMLHLSKKMFCVSFYKRPRRWRWWRRWPLPVLLALMVLCSSVRIERK